MQVIRKQKRIIDKNEITKMYAFLYDVKNNIHIPNLHPHNLKSNKEIWRL